MTQHPQDIAMNLKDQLFDCLPAGRYALAGLLRLVDIVEIETVPSAAVECQAQPRLLINPVFVAEHANTPEKLMMLVMHEIHHVLLGHTRRLSGSTPTDNFVFDCVINALLCRMFPQPAYTALFRDFYPDDAFPACLLRPPADWNPVINKVPVPPALAGKGLGPARQVYQSLYTPEGASYLDIHHVLRAFLARRETLLAGVTLLGDHEGSAQGQATASANVLAGAVEDIVRHWPAPPEPLRGLSMAELLRDSRLRIVRAPSRRRQLRELIGKVAGASGIGQGVRRTMLAEIPIESPLPSADRRAMVSRALGVVPLLYRSTLQIQQPVPAQERVHIYLDVSGSMEGIKGALYGAVLDCEALVHPRVHLFSTRVAEVSPAQLRAGICKSTGGTYIRCVTRHMARHRVKRAVLLTDGYVGRADAAGRQTLDRARIGVAYLGAHTSRLALEPHADASIALDIAA
jgi:hypothetical protein